MFERFTRFRSVCSPTDGQILRYSFILYIISQSSCFHPIIFTDYITLSHPPSISYLFAIAGLVSRRWCDPSFYTASFGMFERFTRFAGNAVLWTDRYFILPSVLHHTPNSYPILSYFPLTLLKYIPLYYMRMYPLKFLFI